MNFVEFPLEEHLSRFIYRVFGFMAIALAITAATAYYVSTVPAISLQFQQPMTLFLLFILQITFVLILSFFIRQLPTAVAIILFFLYALSLGFTLSIIFMIYAQASIYTAFLVASSMFAAMALYGYFTRTDLTAFGSMLFMALIGLIVGLLVNMFLRSPMIDYILSVVGVFIFTLLTAFDVQRIKKLAQQLMADRETMNKIAILGALTLYLDFINLFLYLLRLMGREKE
jgi:FtsH-binding integral membrane protein